MTRVGSVAVKQFASTANHASGSAPAATFGSATTSGNPLLGFVANGTNPAGLTPPTGWTETATIGNLGYNTPASGVETAFLAAGSTSTTYTWGSSSASAYGVIILELDTSTGASGLPITDTFTRTVLDQLGVADTGHLWNSDKGQWATSGTDAGNTSGADDDQATVDTGVTDMDVSGKISAAGVVGALVARWSSTTSYYDLESDDTTLSLKRRDGSGFATLGTSTPGGSLIGQVLTLRVSGTNISALLNGSTVIGPVTNSDITTGTRAGFRVGFNGQPIFDDFGVSTGSTTYTQAVNATATTTATLSKTASFLKTVTATAVTTSASVLKQVRKVLVDPVSVTPFLVRAISLTKSSSSSVTPSVTKQVQTTKGASATTTATLATLKLKQVILTATATLSASVSRLVGKNVTATLTLTPSVVKRIAKTVTASVTQTVTLTQLKVKFVNLTAGVTTSATLTKVLSKLVALTASVSTVPSVVRAIRFTKSTSSTMTPTVSKRVSMTRTATVTSTAVLRKAYSVTLSAGVTILSVLERLASVVGRHFFRPPTYQQGSPWGTNPVTYNVQLPTGYTVLKKDGVYTQHKNPDQGTVAAADVAYIGGYTYEITADEAAALQAAGYTVESS